MGVYRPMPYPEYSAASARVVSSRAGQHRLDEPRQSIPQHGCIPTPVASKSSQEAATLFGWLAPFIEAAICRCDLLMYLCHGRV